MKSLNMFSRQSSLSHKTKKSPSFKSLSMMNSLTLLITILSIFSLSPFSNSQVSAALTPGFCGDCQTFANAIAPCGVTFTNKDIEINGTYTPPSTAAKCICSDVMQRVLWTCARCELLAGFAAKSDPPQKYHTTCISWGGTITEWNAPYTGVVAPGTQTSPLTGPEDDKGTNPGTTAPGTSAGNSGSGTGTATTSGASPSGTSDSDSGSEGSGLNGTAVGISLGIVGIAIIGGAVAVFMMRRSRRRREPLDLDGSYVGLDDQWEKPARSQTPPPMPITSRQPAHISPFESRPGGAGSVVGGYDGQYDQYDQYNQYGGNGGGGGGYGYQGYGNHDQGGYAPEYGYDPKNGSPDYGYDQNVPVSGPYHGGPKSNEGGQYL
ncbi:hypothetical protein BGZ76_009932 [Entomortierella beljakovae]|nr:hypothetical protein BGZ76_009932 [Entomortierella beljakovae]